MATESSVGRKPPRCPCGIEDYRTVFVYREPPEGEVRFSFSSSGRYYREVLQCRVCSHFVSVHEMDMSGMYAGDYVSSTYADKEGILKTFERIIALDPSRSDNHGRVRRILDYVRSRAGVSSADHRIPSVLDVGSGLCVFLHAMKAAGWSCLALDDDERLTSHASEVVGVDAVRCSFMEAGDLGRFDLITFNKVLEHVEDPVAMLAKSASYLGENGLVHLELPDGEAAVHAGPDREEFFIDHHHVFSMASMAVLVAKAGFRLLRAERLHEPSGKYTLCGFAVKPGESDVRSRVAEQ